MEEARQVPTEQAASLAETWNCPFMETSAKKKLNNEECFHAVVREIRKQQEEDEIIKPRRKFCNIL
eukprot:362276-Prorocentrum_lima.AAC.1